MFMRLLCLVLCFILFSCCSVSFEKPPKPKIPDRELKEFFLYGNYNPDDEDQINKPDYSPEGSRYPFLYVDTGYCYKKKKDKEPFYKQNLRARLYDKDKKLLAEDVSRVSWFDESPVRRIVFYFPYFNIQSGEIKVVRLKEGGEDIIRGCLINTSSV